MRGYKLSRRLCVVKEGRWCYNQCAVIVIKSREDIEKMREGSKITAQVREEVLRKAVPGVTTWELEGYARERIHALGGEPGFMRVPGYDYATCINLNEGLVHGIPSKDIVIKEGDLFTVDLGVFYEGFHTDCAWSIAVGQRDSQSVGQQEKKEKTKFLEVGELALEKATEQCTPGNFVGDISNAIQKTIEGAGYNVSRALVGHGVGEELHEGPQIPCYGRLGSGSRFSEGMTVAIEVLYMMGEPGIQTADDGWTIKTKDNSLSGLFENTVAITKNGPEVLTPNPKL